MMQIKGAKSDNTERYKKALGMSSKQMAKFSGAFPSEIAAAERAAAEARLEPEAPSIRAKTDTRVEGEETLQHDEDENDSDLELLADEDDEFMKALRVKRMAEMKQEYEKVQKYKHAGQGSYNEINEDEFLSTLNGSKHVIVHFFHDDFPRCKIVDKHLQLIAKRHLETKIVSMDAAKAKFFTAKLQVRTLPTVVTFVDGVSKSRLVGFEDLGGADHFATEDLETWLRQRGMLKRTAEQEEDDAEWAEAQRERLQNPLRINELDMNVRDTDMGGTGL